MSTKKKNIFDYSHVKSVTAWALIDTITNKPAGKVIANWSDNPNGSTCTAQVFIDNAESRGLTPKTYHFQNSLCDMVLDKPAIGKAGGYGYCKLSSAISEAFNNGFENANTNFAGVGEGAVREYLEARGLKVVSVC